MKKKSILLACIMAASLNTSAKAAEPALDFPIVRMDAEVIEMAAEASTEELCASAALAIAVCDPNLYNTVNVIIHLRDAKNSRACERGYEQGFKDAHEMISSKSAAVQERVNSCQMRVIENYWVTN